VTPLAGEELVVAFGELVVGGADLDRDDGLVVIVGAGRGERRQHGHRRRKPGSFPGHEPPPCGPPEGPELRHFASALPHNFHTVYPSDAVT